MNPANPNISVLIITYNRPDDTTDLLESIRQQKNMLTYVGEILILNNASAVSYQGVYDYLQLHDDLPVHLFNSDHNKGVAGGRNFLIQKAVFPYLLFLDDDVVFGGDNAFEILSSLFLKKYFEVHNTAAITLDIRYYEDGKRQKNAFPHKKHRKYSVEKRFLTSYFIGAAHLMKKALFDQTGLYPEDFFYGMEEYDLSYRIISAGYSIGYDDGVTILHKESPRGRVPEAAKLQMMWYNKCLVAWRYLPSRYFYTTGIMWTLQYFRKTGFDLKGAVKTIRRIKNIPLQTTTHKLSKKAMSYLRSVEARLWY